jgi:hypothetical protein
VNINHIQLCKELVIYVPLVNTIQTQGRRTVRTVIRGTTKNLRGKPVVNNAPRVIMPMLLGWQLVNRVQRVNTQTSLDNTGVNYVNSVKQLTMWVRTIVMIVQYIHMVIKRGSIHVKIAKVANMALGMPHTLALVFV